LALAGRWVDRNEIAHHEPLRAPGVQVSFELLNGTARASEENPDVLNETVIGVRLQAHHRQEEAAAADRPKQNSER